MPHAAPWSLSAPDAAADLSTSLDDGLTAADFTRAREAYGENVLEQDPPRPWWRMLADQFMDWMIGLLAAAGVISAVVGEWEDSVLIAAIVVANGIIGFVQERRAEAALAALKKLSQPFARVWRDGHLREVPAAELVPGDLLEITTGMIIPADARVVAVTELTVDESPLTGESLAVEKHVDPLPADTALPDRTNMLFTGTAVQTGHGQAVVTSIGMQTELGKIAGMLNSAIATTTPLEARLESLSKRLAVIVIAISVVVFVVGVLRSPPDQWYETASEMFLTAVSLAVAAVPEGLPAVITISLALGSQRMVARRAIIRQLSAVETLGSVDVICSDKTGTLTQNKMTVAERAASGGPEAEETLARGMMLCSNVELDPSGELIGSATEIALIAAAREQGLDLAAVRKEWPRQHEFSFSSRRKRMSTVHAAPSGELVVFVKGAVEQILEQSTRVPAGDTAGATEPLDDERRRSLREEAESLASQGRRVLGLAYRVVDAVPATVEDAERDLVFLGYAAIVDPVRPEVRVAIRDCRSAGITPIMITGDHPGTARAIASELELIGDGHTRVVTGRELDAISDDDLARDIGTIGVFARVTPEHKLRIVKAHQANGSIVAMTGDGVNDAPALKQADIGVAMGLTGTDVSKQAAKMVLADDNFATIVAAVEEGRVVYENIRKFVRYLLTSNSAEVLVLFVAIVIGLPLPLVPVQLLWINLVTDGLPALALAFEPAERDVMRKPPRRRDESLFGEGLALDIILFAILMASLCLAIYYWYLPSDWRSWSIAEMRSAVLYPQTVVFTTLSFFQLFHVLAIHRTYETFFVRPWENRVLVSAVVLGAAMQLGVVYLPLWLPSATRFFHVVPLSFADLAISFATASIIFWIIEGQKLWWQMQHTRKAEPQGSPA